MAVLAFYSYNNHLNNLKRSYTSINEKIPDSLLASEETISAYFTSSNSNSNPNGFLCKDNQEPLFTSYFQSSEGCAENGGTGCGHSRWSLTCDSKYFILDSESAAPPRIYGPFNVKF